MEMTLQGWKQGEIVEYDNGVMKGRGRIVGTSTTPCAAIGAGMILEDLSGNIPNEAYPYTHFGIFECHLKRGVGK